MPPSAPAWPPESARGPDRHHLLPGGGEGLQPGVVVLREESHVEGAGAVLAGVERARAAASATSQCGRLSALQVTGKISGSQLDSRDRLGDGLNLTAPTTYVTEKTDIGEVACVSHSSSSCMSLRRAMSAFSMRYTSSSPSSISMPSHWKRASLVKIWRTVLGTV